MRTTIGYNRRLQHVVAMVVRMQFGAQSRRPHLCLLVVHKQDYTFGIRCRLWQPR